MKINGWGFSFNNSALLVTEFALLVGKFALNLQCTLLLVLGCEMLIKSNFSFNIKSMIRLSDDEVFFELENLSFKKSPGDIGDDFRTMFDSLFLKIVVGILLFLVIFFHSTLCLLFLQFEKYGNDPMKRSVANLIVSQIFYGAALSNIIFSPFLTWRVIIGPIQPDLSGKCHFCLIIKFFFIC